MALSVNVWHCLPLLADSPYFLRRHWLSIVVIRLISIEGTVLPPWSIFAPRLPTQSAAILTLLLLPLSINDHDHDEQHLVQPTQLKTMLQLLHHWFCTYTCTVEVLKVCRGTPFVFVIICNTLPSSIKTYNVFNTLRFLSFNAQTTIFYQPKLSQINDTCMAKDSKDSTRGERRVSTGKSDFIIYMLFCILYIMYV